MTPTQGRDQWHYGFAAPSAGATVDLYPPG